MNPRLFPPAAAPKGKCPRRPVGLTLGLMSLAVLLLIFGACSREAGLTNPTVLVFKHGKMGSEGRIMAGLLHEFERQHPGIIVREEVLPSSSDQQHQFYAITLDSRHVPFDVMAVDTIWVQEFARAGWILPLDEILPPQEREHFFSNAVQAAVFGQRIYGVPWYVDAGVLYYRRDLLDRYGFAPPRTWEELVDTARTVVEKEGNPRLAGFVWQGKQYEGLVCNALEMMWAYGGDLLEGSPESTAAALAFMRSLVEDGISPRLVVTADEEMSRHFFGSGRAVFMRNWPYAYPLYQSEGSDLRGKVGLGPLPSASGQTATSVLGGWVLTIPREAAHPEEGKQLIRFLTSRASQHRLAVGIGYNPSRLDLFQDKALLAAYPWLVDLYPVLRDARPRPVTPYYLMLSQLWQPELSAALVGRKTASAAVASGRRQAARLLNLGEREPDGIRP